MTSSRMYTRLGGGTSRRIRTPHHAAHFRTVAGEKLAGIQQVERLVKRAFVRESRVSIWKVSSIERHAYWPVADSCDLGAVGDETRDLLDQISELRRLLAKTRRAWADRSTPVNADLGSAAELLAVLEPDEAECVLEVLISGQAYLPDIVRSLGAEKFGYISNLVGKARVAVVSGHRMVATSFGLALGKWVVEMTNSPEVESECGLRRD